MARGRGRGRGRRSSSRNLGPSKDSWTSSSKIAKSLGTRSSRRLASRCKKVQYIEQSIKEGSLDESSSASHLKEANVNNHVDTLDGSSNVKLAVNEGRLRKVHSSSEDEKALDEFLLIPQYADEAARQAAAIYRHAPCTSTSKATENRDKNKSVVAKAPQVCAMEDSHFSGERHPGPADPSIAHVIEAANMGRPTPSSAAVGSFLTDIVNMFQYDSSDEAEVGSAPPLVRVHEYNVKEASAGVLRAIITKYGDIAANCSLTSAECRSCLLERICDIVQALKEKEFKDVCQEIIKKHIDNVADLMKIEMNVEWLWKRLEGIYNAKLLIEDMRALKKGKNKLIRERDEAKAEIERVNKNVLQAKAKMRYAEAEIERINKSAVEAKPIVLFYAREGSMVDGLL